MNSEKYCDYYMVRGDDVAMLLSKNEGVEKKRDEVIEKAMAEVGATAYTKRSEFSGKSSLLSWFAWPAGFDFNCETKVINSSYLDGEKVFVVKGKGNRKCGKEFNKKVQGVIDSANSELELLPTFKDMIINHYGVGCTGLGEATGRGTAMLSTRAGTSNDKSCLLFAIPNEKSRGSTRDAVKIPECFEKISYGKFYDLANGDS